MNNKKQAIWTPSFWGVSLVNLIVFTVFYALITTLPVYVIYDLKGTEAQGGLVVTIMLISSILMRPLSGNIIQRWGKRRMLIVSTAAFALTTAGYMVFNQFIPMTVVRFIHGLSFGLLSTTTYSIAADIVPSERKGEGLGYFTMFMNVAVVIGPLVGLTLIQFVSFQTWFIILSLFVMISVVFALNVKLEAPAPQDKPETPGRSRKRSVHDLFELKVLPISFVGCLVAFAYSGILSFASVFAVDRGLESVSGYFFLIFAVTMVISRPFLGKLFDQRGPKVVLIPCMIVFAVGLLVLSTADSAGSFLASAAVIALGYGSLLPFLLSMAVDSVAAQRNGHATATFFVLFDSGVAIGSSVLGLAVRYTGFSHLFMYLAGFVVLIAIVFYFVNRSKQAAGIRPVEVHAPK